MQTHISIQHEIPKKSQVCCKVFFKIKSYIMTRYQIFYGLSEVSSQIFTFLLALTEKNLKTIYYKFTNMKITLGSL